MKTEDRKIDGDVEIRDKFILTGIINGHVTVIEEAILYLHGKVTKNLFVKNGAKAYIHGTVLGNVTNQGRVIEVYGTIPGKLVNLFGSRYVDTNAIISGK